MHTYLMHVHSTWRAPQSTILEKNETVDNQISLSNTSSQVVLYDLAVLILACNRQAAVEYALLSLSKAYYSKQTSVYISIDCMPGVRVEPQNNEVYFKSLTFWNSKQRFKKEKEEIAWRKDEKVTRHWIEAVTKVLKLHTHVLYLEEDHIVHPSILADAFVLLDYQAVKCPTCFSVQMGCHGDCWGMKSPHSNHIVRMEPGNMGVVYSQTKWLWFLKNYLHELCTYYGSWDVLMHHVLFKSKNFMHSLTYLNPRVLHHNLCSSDRTSDELHCNINQLKVVSEEFTSRDIGLRDWDGLIDNGIAHFPNMVIPEKSLSLADKLVLERCMQSILV